MCFFTTQGNLLLFLVVVCFTIVWGEEGRKMTLTDRIDQLMAKNGIKTKAELSRLTEIPYTTIDGFYKKGTDRIKLSTLQKLCDVLGCSIDYLASGKDQEKKNSAAIDDLVDAASGNDEEDIRRAADQLRRIKAYKEAIEKYERQEANDV